MKENLIGKKFNRWTVIDYAPNKNRAVQWKCQCDCGTIRDVSSKNLKTNHSKSCGCLRKIRASETHSIDLTGKQIGQLIVLERDENIQVPKNHRFIMWKCQCDCGNIVTISSDNLKRQKSCGCIKSFGEQEIQLILSENNIDFIREYKIKELNNLRFDFYLPNFNRLIEFDGIQHFQPIDYFGGENTFLNYQKNDKLKNDYANKYNIPLVRIPYYEKGKITLEMLLGDMYLI